MDAVKYFEERARMLKSGQGFEIRLIESGADIERAVEIVENWSAAHPQKTQADLFFERYPNAIKNGNGLPGACPKEIGLVTTTMCTLEKSCVGCRKKYWSAPVEG